MSAAATPVIGTTSYGFRYQLLDARLAPSLHAIVEQTRTAGLDALQICENARPLDVAPAAWQQVVRAAGDQGIALALGCMTLDLEVLARYLERAAVIPGASTLRLVLEDDSGRGPARPAIEHFLERAATLAIEAGMTLVLENHFHIPCHVLADVGSAYSEDVIAFCVDSANSLRSWESSAEVFRTLGSRAAFYHLKDYRVQGSNVGFAVTGAPLGEGDLDLEATLDAIHRRHRSPVIYLENWVPSTGDRQADAAADADWLGRSRRALEQAWRRRWASAHATVPGSIV